MKQLRCKKVVFMQSDFQTRVDFPYKIIFGQHMFSIINKVV